MTKHFPESLGYLWSSAPFVVQFLGWTQKKPPTPTAVMERKSFISKKVNGKISYAEITVMKHNDKGFVFNESQVSVVS